jgi:hypothetical protein
MTDDTTCHGCGRTNSGAPHVCENCRQRAAEQLAELARHAPLLPMALIPGATRDSGGVKTTKSDSAPLPLRLDAFSLLAAGTFDPDLREGASQVGIVPLRVWLEEWYEAWAERYHFGPRVAPRVNIPAVKHSAAPGGSAALMRRLLTASKIVVEMHHGPGDGYKVTANIADTTDAEYAARFGRPPATALVDMIAALASRLDAACDDGDDIADFLTGLRIMLGACRAVLGERSNLTFIGPCPERRIDRETGSEGPCGGAIWQDAYVSLIRCPRCKHDWPDKEWLALGARIRAQRPTEAQVHAFEGKLTVIYAEKPGPNGPIEVDRYWATRCNCGQWSEQVRGVKLDARGRWRTHVKEMEALMLGADERMAG